MPATDNYHLGNVVITRITEQLFSMPLAKLLPDATDTHIPAGMDAQTPIEMSVHSWLIDAPQGKILIDTATGNGKERPFSPLFHRLSSPWMDNLKQTGIQPEDIDYVLHTHLHTDHVGWNTVWDGDKWRPAFNNATWVCSQAELDFVTSPAAEARRMVFDDSILPIIDSGRLVTVPDTRTAFLPGVIFYPTPGHSAGHMSIALETDEGMAIFCGDLMHTPLQVAHPELSSVFCRDAEQANQSRQWLLNFAASRRAKIFTSHFSDSSAGYVTNTDEGFAWKFEGQHIAGRK
ncbi:MBL fold metallo-hydrolase [Salmonella enterica subsp. enterica serovar Choleraesuis]|nr:MBL fold metallo-hydrolase [Salmonella enterica subsp. enterica serovar Choleraesuis]